MRESQEETKCLCAVAFMRLFEREPERKCVKESVCEIPQKCGCECEMCGGSK